jgi:hypothetical protein
MIAADKFDRAVSDVLMRVLGADEFVVFDFEAVFLPTAGLSDHVEKRQMTL